MADTPEANAIDEAIVSLQRFLNSEAYRVLKVDEKKAFDKIITFMHEQIKQEQQGKSVDSLKFNQELTKKLNRFNAYVQNDLDQRLIQAGVIKKEKLPSSQQKMEQLRKENVIGAIEGIIQKIPQPETPAENKKRVFRPRKIMDKMVRGITGKSAHFRERAPVVFRSDLSHGSSKSSQKALQQEFGQYAQKLVTYANNKYGKASDVFSESFPTAEEIRKYNRPTLASNTHALVGDFIAAAHRYPETQGSRDQLVINALHHYEDKYRFSVDNELMSICNTINSINSLRTKIDKIYGYLKESPPNIDMLLPNLSLIKPEAEILAQDLGKIHDPDIKKIAKEVIKLADKLTDSLPKDIKNEVKKEQEKAEQLVGIPRKKPGMSPP